MEKEEDNLTIEYEADNRPRRRSFDNIEAAGDPDEEDSEGSPGNGIIKDSPRSWLVCAGAFSIQLFIMGFSHAFGVFFVVFVDEFQCSSAKAG